MNVIRAENVINCGIEKAWEMFTNPKYIVKWYSTSDDWECTYAKNELHADGTFVYRMTAKDKSASFNLMGKYKEIILKKSILYVTSDKKSVGITFEKILERETRIIILFQPDFKTSEGEQQFAWQTLLNNFKKYVEGSEDIKITTEKGSTWLG